MQLFFVDYDKLTRERMFLFGMASLWIFFRHTIHIAHFQYFFCFQNIVNIGDAGVDIFLFLSGFGLTFSLYRTPLKIFYLRRFFRIIPTYLFFYYLIAFVSTSPQLSIINFLKTTYLSYWYILFIVIMYAIFPVIHKIIHILGGCFLLLICFISFVYLIYDYKICGGTHNAVYVARIPVFITGVYYAHNVSLLRNKWLNLSLLFLGIICMIMIPMDLKIFRRLLYMPLIIGLLPLLCIVSAWIPKQIKIGVVFLGTISLEFYLVHGYLMISYLNRFHSFFLSQSLSIITILGITIVLSYIIQCICNPLSTFICKIQKG